jgi:Leucine-rich repeat (LRR) protein
MHHLNVDELNLANNHLEGKFPVCNQQRRATTLILRNNMLSGKLQLILETYTELNVLDLAWNNFTGSIPATITRLVGLFHLNLAGNGISGTLPHDLSNLRVMKTGYTTSDYSGTVNMSMTMKGQELYYYSSAFSRMVVIDLSSNHLTGGIPEEIASLYAVVNLNLSRNNLTGKIPERIGVMQSLESLDLSRNNLYGEIPRTSRGLVTSERASQLRPRAFMACMRVTDAYRLSFNKVQRRRILLATTGHQVHFRPFMHLVVVAVATRRSCTIPKGARHAFVNSWLI